MPYVVITTNVLIEKELKFKLGEVLSNVYAEQLKTDHLHCNFIISDGQHFSYAGNSKLPACLVTVKSSQQQIAAINRKELVIKTLPALFDAIPRLVTERVTTIFEEYPVENICVGDFVMVFSQNNRNNNSNSASTFGPEP